MLHGVKTNSAYLQIKSEGLLCLYRGILPPLCQKTISMSLMFGVYAECKRPLLATGMDPYVAKTIAGIVAGNVEAILMPFERIQTLLVDPAYNTQFKNTKHIAYHIATNYGIKEFYRGLVPILYRNGPSNALYFIIRDELHERLPTQDVVFYQTLQAFIAGASIGAFLSTLFYPLNVVKFNVQSKMGVPYEGMIHAFITVYKERGSKFRNFYHGASMNCTRAFLSWGIITAAHHFLHKTLL